MKKIHMLFLSVLVLSFVALSSCKMRSQLDEATQEALKSLEDVKEMSEDLDSLINDAQDEIKEEVEEAKKEEAEEESEEEETSH